MEKIALMALAVKSLQEVKDFYRAEPDGQWPWTAMGEDRYGHLHVFRMNWDADRSSDLYNIAEAVMREQKICRYILSSEAWLELPEGRQEAVMIAGSDISGERYGMTFQLTRNGSGVVFSNETVMSNEQCRGDVYTLLGGNL